MTDNTVSLKSTGLYANHRLEQFFDINTTTICVICIYSTCYGIDCLGQLLQEALNDGDISQYPLGNIHITTSGNADFYFASDIAWAYAKEDPNFDQNAELEAWCQKHIEQTTIDFTRKANHDEF